MAVREIITGEDNPVLRKKTTNVPSVTKEVLKLLIDLEDTRMNAQGAGIAAPQIGHSERVCIAVIGGKATALVNPKILKRNDNNDIAEEGCLSLPNVWIDVPRATEIILKYTDEKGVTQERMLKNWDARVVQHELDHLDGVLIVDYLKDRKSLPHTASKL